MAHLRLCNLDCGSISASLITPDMSLPALVRLLSSRLRGKCKCSAGADTLGREASVPDTLQSGADRDVLRESLGRLGANALARQIPRFDLVSLVLAESLEERSPVLVAKLVVAQTASGAGDV